MGGRVGERAEQLKVAAMRSIDGKLRRVVSRNAPTAHFQTELRQAAAASPLQSREASARASLTGSGRPK